MSTRKTAPNEKSLDHAGGRRDERVQPRRERRAVEQRDVRPSHHVQIDRVERGHHENAGEQLGHAKPRVQHAGHVARNHPGEERRDRRERADRRRRR